MDAVRESWTDERLDDLKAEVGSLRTELGELRRETRAEFSAVRGEIAALHRLILQVGGGIVVTMLIGFLGIAIQL
jgi:hypothetical protein